MTNNYSADSTNKAKNFTQSTETNLAQEVRSYSDFLPYINRSESVDRFFKSTVDQLLSSGSTESLDTHWGRLSGRGYNAGQELFMPETDEFRLNYQFAPGVSQKSFDGVEATVTYANSLKRFKNLGSNIDNHDKLFSEPGYTLDLPINIDMFNNSSNYYWLEGDIPLITIEPTVLNPINIDDIIARSAYTTPVLTNNKTVKFVNGLRVTFKGAYATSAGGAYAVDAIYYIEGVGSDNIRLVQTVSAAGLDTFPYITPYSVTSLSGWDAETWDDFAWNHPGVVAPYVESTTLEREDLVLNKSYFVMDRGCIDKNPWARSNRWFSIYALRITTEYNEIDIKAYVNRTTKAKRPIIEYRSDMELYNSGKNYIYSVDYMITEINSTTDIIGQSSYSPPNTENQVINGDTIALINDAAGRAGIYTIAGVGTSIILSELISTSLINNDDKIIITQGDKRGYEYHWVDITWIESQQKLRRGTNTLFELFEDNISNDILTNGIITSNGSFIVDRYGNFVVPRDFIILTDGVTTSDGNLIISRETSFVIPRDSISFSEGITLSNGNITISRDGSFIIPRDHVLVTDGILSAAGNYVIDRNGDYVIPRNYVVFTNGITTSDGNYIIDRNDAIVIPRNHLSASELTIATSTTLVKLSDYADSDFAGEPIFTYKVSSAGVYDHELDITPSYSNTTAFNDFDFAYTLNNTRYYTNLTTSTREEICGLYNFSDYTKEQYFNCWSNIRGSQRVPIIQTQISDGSSTVSFDLKTLAVDNSTEYTVVLNGKNLRFSEHNYIDVLDIGYPKPGLVFKTDTNYTINNLIWDPAQDIEFVNPYGVVDPNISVTTVGNIITLNISSSYIYEKVKYRSVGDNTNAGFIFVSNNNQSRYEIRKNGQLLIVGTDYTVTTTSTTVLTVTSSHIENDVFELSYVADSDVVDAVYEVAPVHFYNTKNDPYTGGSFSTIRSHFEQQLIALPGFDGIIFGENNYTEIRRFHTFNGLIRQQIFETSKLNYLLDQPDINPIKTLKITSNDYTSFKTFFKNKVKQLWTTSSFTSVRDLVDQALTEINIGKNNTFKYAYSDMALYSGANELVYSINDGTTSFTLPEVVNTYRNTRNHLNIWLNEYNITTSSYYTRPLIYNEDYYLAGNKIVIVSPVKLNVGLDPATLTIKWFDYNQTHSYIPFSAVKLGFIRPTIVEIDNGILTGHDGSKHTATNTEFYDLASSSFDVVTASLYDLELRIFNNLVDDHYTSFDLAEMYPGPHNKYSYTVDDMTSRLDDWFTQYILKNNITNINIVPYSASDKFTWNYSTVGPKLGGWRAIYHYYFGTDRPHTHPWEMLGFKSKPDWWDGHYSWAFGPTRDALIVALKSGLVVDPALAADIKGLSIDLKYARNKYDWDNNVLVTTSGVLNDPVTANVVSAAPAAIDAAKDFVFGDWGEIENDWRNTSEYNFALAEVYLQLKPYRTHELFWRVGKWVINYNVTQTQWIDNITSQRTDSGEIHKQLIKDGILGSANINNGGTGYSNVVIKFPNVSTCDESAIINVWTAGGTITAIEITDPGRGYTAIPPDTILSVTTGEGADISYIMDVNYYATNLGFNSLAAEEFTKQEPDSTELADIFSNIAVEYMIHVGGFTDKRILSLEVDSSYENGKTQLPETSYDIIIDKNAPLTNVFYSGVKIAKIDGKGYKVTGYNLDSQYFTYLTPSDGGRQVDQNITSTTTVIRHLNFKNESVSMMYDTILRTRQELYSFLIGLGEYYNRLGFDVKDQWITDADNAIIWTLSNDTNDYYLNGISSVLKYGHGTQGQVADIDVSYNGTINIFDKNQKEISKTDLYVLRNDDSAEYSLINGSNRIYGIGINVIEFEHIIVLSNVTEFNDVIYNPTNGFAQNRIKLVGQRTRNWSGKIEAPGYLINNTGITLNIESSVREMERDWINQESKTLESLTRQTQGYNVGYVKPTYLKDIFISDQSAVIFNKGKRKYKGTELALNAMTNNKNIFGTDFAHTFSDEWMVRLGEYGDLSESNPLQFVIDTSLIKSDSQLFRFSKSYLNDADSNLVIDLHENGTNSVSGDYDKPFDKYPIFSNNNTSISTANKFQHFINDAGLPLTTEIDYFIKSINDIGTVYDPTADYALINNWSDGAAYIQGDKVRKDGKVYQLNIATTGINNINENVIIRGNQVFPTVTSNSTFIANGNTVTFNKSSTDVTYNTITLLGTVINPSTPDGTILNIDGLDITFNKSESVTTINDIVVDGTVTNPEITNAALKKLIIDSVDVNFNEETTTETLQQIYADAFSSIVGFTGSPDSVATTRINDLEALRLAYVAATSVAAWETWITNYYIDAANATTQDVGVNPEYLGAQIAANLGASWETTARAFLANDLDLMNRVTGNAAETVQNVIDDTWVNLAQYTADITATKLALSTDPNIAELSPYMKTNGSVVLAAGLIITVTTPTPIRYITDLVTDIKNKINAASIPGVTASIVNSAIRLTSTNSTMVIAAATGNADVGFPTSATTYNATSNTVTAGVDLTITEVLAVINNANITGVSAGVDTSNRLELRSINTSLTIGTSTGTSIFGFTAGTTNATITTTVSDAPIAIYDVVNQINAAAILDLTASIINGALLLTYTSDTLIIGPGTANAELGITDGTYLARVNSIKNTFDVSNWDILKEPAEFNIWAINNIATDAAIQSAANIYNVYQTIDLQIGITQVCAGAESGDDAAITTNKNHDLAVDDYVLIVNSTSVPSIDGIHRVTGVLTDNLVFFIDKYIEEKGFTGTVIPLRQMRFSDSNAANAMLTDGKYVNDDLGIPDGAYVYVDAQLDSLNNPLGYGGVYKIVRAYQNRNTIKLVPVRDEIAKTNNSTIVNGKLFNYINQETVAIYEIFDPLKNLLPGAVDREIDIKQDVDIAAYNNTTDITKELVTEQTWSGNHVGLVWWDLSNAIYLNYDQGSDEYKQENWGQLYPTSTIDIYEWTKSPVTPDEYEKAVQSNAVIDGIELTGTPYTFIDQFGDNQYYWSEDLIINKNTNQIETYYYFWVKDKTTVPTVDREHSTIQIANIIENPSINNVPWLAATSENTLIVNGLLNIDNNLLMQINMNKNNTDYHQEFLLLAENDSYLPEWLHIGLRDSLAGFTQLTKSVDYTTWNALITYNSGDAVYGSDLNYYICLTTSLNNDPVTDLTNDYWRILVIDVVDPDGEVTIPETSNLTYLTPTVIPNTKLHKLNRYGIGIRPHQSMFVDIPYSRQMAIEKLNSQLLTINLLDSDIDWRSEFDRTYTVGTKTYDIRIYWSYVDWNIDPNNPIREEQSDHYVDNITDLATLIATEGQIAHVTFSNDSDELNRHTLWQYTNSSWKLIFKEKGTIAFNSLLWDSTLNNSGWDILFWDSDDWDTSTGKTVFEIFDSFYKVIFAGNRTAMYTDFWFHMAKHILHEQANVDWLFKSSYFKLRFETSLEQDYNKFFKQNVDQLFDYIDDVKPFRSKLRDATLQKNVDETANITNNALVEFRVQTNPAGSTVDTTNTRSFKITIDQDNNQLASQIEENRKSALGLDISASDTVLPTLYSGQFPNASGVVWINGERITYSGISGELLTGCVRGTNGTLAKAHIAFSIIEDGTNDLELSIASDISANGNNITPAFNELGKTLLDATNGDALGTIIRNGEYGEIIISDMQAFIDALVILSTYPYPDILAVQVALENDLEIYWASI